MALVKRAVILYWADSSGATCAMPIVTQDQTQLGSIPEQPLIDAMQAVSEAGLTAILIREFKMIEEAPGTGPYATMLDVANFTYLCADGTNVLIPIFAPDEAIFLDELNVDLDNPAVEELIAQTTAIASGISGSPVVSLVAATRGIVPRQSTPTLP